MKAMMKSMVLEKFSSRTSSGRSSVAALFSKGRSLPKIMALEIR